jgi:hypothetical protein
MFDTPLVQATEACTGEACSVVTKGNERQERGDTAIYRVLTLIDS